MPSPLCLRAAVLRLFPLPRLPARPLSACALSRHALAASAPDGEPLQTPGVLSRRLESLSKKVEGVESALDLPLQRAKLADLELRAGAADFWERAAEAQRVLASIAEVRAACEQAQRCRQHLADAQTALELLVEERGAEAEPEAAGGAELFEEACSSVRLLERELGRWETERLLSAPHASRGAVLTLTCGAGGSDAADWTAMLQRMYERWAALQGYGCEVLELSEGEEAGVKSVTLELTGRFAYGYLAAEKGTHRLVRISPFNSKSARQTSFCGVEVMPVLEAGEAGTAGGLLAGLDLPESELEISFTRSGGKGGQNVNKVETAVRIRHVPTGLQVKCSAERSQARNREKAMEILRAKLVVIAEEQRCADVASIRGERVKAEWGQQIRNYVLNPYQLVKDLRTGKESGDVASVLGGEGLQGFVLAYLQARAEGTLAQTGAAGEEEIIT